MPRYDLPLEPDLMTAPKALRDRGLLTRRSTGGGMDAWTVTGEGRARLEELEAR